MKLQRIIIAMTVAIAACGGDSASDLADDGLRLTPDTGGAVSDLGSRSDGGGMTGVDVGADATPGRDLGGAECLGDIDCQDDVFCNGVERCFRGLCFPSPTIQCADNSACTRDVCDEVEKRCEFVPDDSMCAPGQVCNSKGGCFTPAQCTADTDCDDGLLCNGAERCLGGQCEPGTAVECSDGVSCTADVCVEGTGECQSVPAHVRCLQTELCLPGVGCSARPTCMRDDDCDDGLYCNGTETCGADGVCIPGDVPVALDAVDCTIDQCNEALDMVVNTPDNARCSDGAYCNGAELCHPVDGCGPGSPPVVSDGVGCTTDSCDEALNFIIHTPDDSLCDDTLFCNGAEVCHPIDDCSPGEPPMLNDGVGCTIDTCSETMGQVLHVADSGACNDGLFCNGVETCDPVNDCQNGAPPALSDGVTCTVDACDEGVDTVTHSPNDALCGNGNACTTSEVCDVAQDCVAGPPVVVDDGVACTIDACDPATGVSNTPDDGACDDGMFCNGVETCGAAGCNSGAPPNLDDGDACTIDTCNESTDSISHSSASNGTSCGSSLICVGGSCTASVCGDSILDGSRGEQCDDGNTTNGDGCSSTCQTEVIVSCDPNGTWALDQIIAYTCCLGNVDVAIASFAFTGNGAIATSSPASKQLTGSPTSCPVGGFDVSGQITGGCTESYRLVGSFTSDDTWTASYELTYTGADCECGNLGVCNTDLDCPLGLPCIGSVCRLGEPCVDQTFNRTATRQ